MLTGSRARSLLGLTTADWWAMVRAQRALLAAEWSVRTRRTGHLLAAAAPSGARWTGAAPAGPPHESAADSPAMLTRSQARSAMRLALAVHRAARFGVFRPRCLTRSIALHRLLRHARLPAEIRVGVRREGATILAHAWVELYGQVLGDRVSHVSGYTPLADFDPTP